MNFTQSAALVSNRATAGRDLTLHARPGPAGGSPPLATNPRGQL